MQRFAFEFTYPVAASLIIPGITPRTAYVDVGNGGLFARFGPWTLQTPIENIIDVSVARPYHWWRVIGVRLSRSDRGITFGSSTRQGLCLDFVHAVPALLPLRAVRHPALTVTVADPEGLSLAIHRG